MELAFYKEEEKIIKKVNNLLKSRKYFVYFQVIHPQYAMLTLNISKHKLIEHNISSSSLSLFLHQSL